MAETIVTLADGAVKEEIAFANKYTGEGEGPDVPPVEPDTPDKPDEKPGNDAADTGDNANIFLYLAILFASAAVVLAVYIFRNKKE